MAEDVSGSLSINTSGAEASVGKLQQGFNTLFASMGDSTAMKALANFDILQTIISKVTEVTKQLINESRELIAVSTRYDVPISKMGQLQGVANMTGQSVGQVARNLRFFENNISKALLKVDSPQYRLLRDLGLDDEQIKQGGKDTTYALDAVREKILTIGDEERRNAIMAELFGANWALMLPILEANKTQLKDLEAGGYKYSESITRSLAVVEQNGDAINQNLKPLSAFFASVFAMLTVGISAAVLGVVTLAKILKDAVGGAITYVVAYWSKFVAALDYGMGMIEEAIPGGSDGKERKANAIKSFNEADKKLSKVDFFDEKAFAKAAQQGQRLQDQFAQTGYGVLESVGIVEENALMKDTVALMEQKKAEINGYKKELEEQARLIRRANELYEDGTMTARQRQNVLNEAFKKQTEIGDKLEDAKETLSEIQARYERISNTTKDIEKNGKFTPATAEEAKVALLREQQANERAVKEAMAQTPIGQQQETYYAIYEARLKQIKIEKDIAALQKANLYDINKQAEMENQLANAKTSVIEAERAHENFLLKQARQRVDSERDRREIMVKAMSEREQTFMARQGMTGIDKQITVFSNAIEKLQRDQERLAQYENDPKRTLEEKLSARKEVEASTIAAQKELDKATLMQFQYGASDAAKKGMGGGIDIRENQLQISKDQLDILKKQLDLMYKQFNINPLDYGNVPLVMNGAQRMK